MDNDKANKAHFIDQFTKTYSPNHPMFFTYEPKREIVSDSIEISTVDFRKKINSAFKLMKEKAPRFYAFVSLFNTKICARDDDASKHRNASYNHDTQTITIYSHGFMGSDLALASTIVHETVHHWQQLSQKEYAYHENRDDQTYNFHRQRREHEAYQLQVEFLREVGGEEAEGIIGAKLKHRTHRVRYGF